MSQPSRTISLEIEVEEGPLHGRVAVGGACQEFAGWLGLLTVLGHLLDDPTPGAESSPPPTDTHSKEHPMFKRTTTRVSPATVIASMALFASLGGVGYAAATIGSAQIKNNSVQGKDIKNGTIKSPDIAKGTRDALKGQTGARGAAGANGTNGTNGTNGANGAPGQKGDTGASGLSRVIARSNPAAFDPPNVLTSVIPGPTNALLPAGVHVITVQAQVNPTAANWSMTCDVTLGGDLIDRMTSAGAAALDRTQIVGHAVVQTDALKALDLLCTDAGTGTILDDLTVSSMEVNEIG